MKTNVNTRNPALTLALVCDCGLKDSPELEAPRCLCGRHLRLDASRQPGDTYLYSATPETTPEETS